MSQHPASSDRPVAFWARRPWRTAVLAAVSVGILFGMAWVWTGRWMQGRRLEALRGQASVDVDVRRGALEAALQRRLAVIDAFHAFVELSLDRGALDRDFDLFAARLHASVPGIRNLAVARGTTYVLAHPLVGNETVIGYDPAHDARPEVRAAIRQVMDSRRRVLSDALDLVQGGLGAVARRRVHHADRPWGLVGVAFDLEPVLREAELGTRAGSIEVAVRAGSGRLLRGSPTVFADDPVRVVLDLDGARWEVAGRPRGGWTRPIARERRLWFAMGGVLALVPMGLVFIVIWRQTMLRDAARRAERLVGERTAALATTTDLLQSVMQASPLPIVTLDLESRVTSWNDAAERVFGWAAAEVMGAPNPIVPDARRDESRAFQQRMIDGETLPPLELVRQRKDGSLIAVRLSTALMLGPGRRPLGVMAVIEDISERQRVERALRSAMVIVENSPVVVVRWLREPGWPVEYVSENISQLGYTADDFLSRRVMWADILVAEDRDRAVEQGRLFREQGVCSSRQEYRILTKDGRVRWVEDRTTIGAEGDRTYLQGVIIDITERKLAEAARDESDRRLREMFEHVHMIAVVLDVHERVTFCNGYLANLTGWDRDDLVGRNWFDTCIPADWREKARQGFRRDVAAGGFTTHVENPIVTRGGETRDIVWDNTAVLDTAGRLIGSASLGRDVTEQRRLENQYRQAQKMEAVGQLAGGVAHDFNNLLQVITGYASLALSDLGPDQGLHHELTEIKRAADRARTLVTQLLAFSRRQTMERRAIDLNETVGNLLTMLRRVIGEHIELVFEPGSDVAPAWADPGRVEQVLMNLAVNARDAMPGGGRISIAVAQVRLGPEFCERRPWAREGDFVLLRVGDNGPGMPPEVAEHVFEPFFTTKEVGKGTGLGLSTVYGIVKQHDGLIDVWTAPGHGTSFSVYLPCATRAPVSSEPPAGPVQAPGGHETILLAEDEEHVRELSMRVLRRAGYRVLVACDGMDAVALFDAHDRDVSLAVLDVLMPRLSGPQVRAHIQARRPGLPVLLCSGYSPQALTETSATVADGDDLLFKPFEPSALLDRVRQMLGRAAADQIPTSRDSFSGPT